MQILQHWMGCEGYWSHSVNKWLCNVNMKGLTQKWFWSISRYFVTFKIMVFWHTTPYSMVNRHQCSGGTHFLHHQDRRLREEPTASINFNVRDGSSGFFWNVGIYLPDYISSHPGRFMFNIHSHENLKFCISVALLGGAMKNCEECQDSEVHPEIYTGLTPNTSQKHYFCC